MDDHDVDQRASAQPPQAPPPTRQGGSWLARLLAEPSVRITVIAWLAANVAVVLIARGQLPFHRPTLHGTPYLTQVLSPDVAIVEVLALMAVVFARGGSGRPTTSPSSRSRPTCTSAAGTPLCS